MKRLTAYQNSFKNYITKNHISIKNVRAISKWIKKQKYIYLIIYNKDEIVYESGYWDDKYSAYEFSGVPIESDPPVFSKSPAYNTGSDFYIEQMICEVEFKDGKYCASFIDSSELKWYSIVAYVSIILFFLALFVILILYNRYIITLIMRLSKDVSLIEQGNLEQPIECRGNDEIALLAINANNMRNSIIAWHNSEKEAWEMNNELITSMSHDIRTPLTALIGYLEILDARNYNSEEQLEKYIKSCKDKSIQLKDLSDKLFQYFLVFGKENLIMQMETFDVTILFQQLLGEQIFNLNNLGFRVETDFTEQTCSITADIQYLKRLFDNLFSNVRKYADINCKIVIKSYIEGCYLHISITNNIRKDSVLLESTNIGLRTCQKIVEQMNGTFDVHKELTCFEVKTIFPIELSSKE
jgi:His Kinase A (phosphoacceptor) domain./Histidine kinase-, DNA gyrase B-, and HSP90-like ATPase./HAMP domain.